MFSNLTYKQKCLALILGFILLFLASYKKTIRSTIASKEKLNQVESQLLNVGNSYNELNSLSNEVKKLDHVIGGGNLNPELVQQSILDFITNQDIVANIVRIGDVHIYLENDFKVFTNQIEVEGEFNALVTLLYRIEREFVGSRITSISMYSKKNFRTNRTKLFLKLVLQNYEKN